MQVPKLGFPKSEWEAAVGKAQWPALATHKMFSTPTQGWPRAQWVEITQAKGKSESQRQGV